MFRVAVCTLLLTAASFVSAQPNVSLQWPQTYTTSGFIVLPYNEIYEPFEATVDTSSGKSYINTYAGTSVVINRGDMGDQGTMFKIVPETTKLFVNRITCFKIPGMEGAKVVAQSVLPNASFYTYVGDYPYNGVKSRLYISSFSVGTKVNNYTLFTHPDTGYPLFFRFIGYDRLFGSHYDEYMIQYNNFSTNIDATKFDTMNGMDCISFPGPGSGGSGNKKEQKILPPMAENPMFEFVGAEGYKNHHQTAKVDSEFETFKSKHGRSYQNAKEEAERKTHFRHNHRYVNSLNRKKLSFSLKLNHLSDKSDVELTRLRGYRHTKDSPRGELYVSTKSMQDVPTSYNWWQRGAVTKVKDQGICGSCWSFGTTGTLEGSLFIKTGTLMELSEQALIDCSWGYGNNGCDGGESERSYQWIIDNGCIPSSVSYQGGRYLMVDSYCLVNQSRCGASISKFYNTPSGNVSALVMAIYEKGPISVAIDASLKTFSFYDNGVYYDANCGNTADDLDHQVLAVGYGTLDGEDYWLVKNSWSTHWGNDGYILMSRKDNNCGVATDASYADIV